MLTALAVYGRTYFATPKPFRPHVGGAVAHWARGERQRKAWAPHLSKARALIDTTIDDLADRRTVVVLGSSALFEIPVESLARTFRRVILVDQVHPSPICRRIARYDNVECPHRELSPLREAEPLGFLGEIDDLDWVISSMLVSRLAPSDAPGDEASAAISDHLATLACADCAVTLLTDVDLRVMNRHGVVRHSVDLLHGVPVPRSELRWKWEAAPFGEDHRHLRRVHTVAAWPDWRQAWAEMER